MPKRVQRKRIKGYKNTGFYCGRPGKFGNPFSVKRFGRAGALRLFDAMLASPEQRKEHNYPTDEEIRAELRGKDLSCFCNLFEDCHVDRLLRISNS